jgi:hypothetical protein
MGYDLIGDIHGSHRTLAALLDELRYVAGEDGVRRHPDRTAIFLGDFIDRGPGQREVIETVRPMIETGAALAVMGNHEYNAVAYATPDPAGGWLRRHSEKHARQHAAFLDAYPFGSADHADVIAWFRTLPLWLDLDGLRVVHACWDPDAIAWLADACGPGARLTDAVLVASCTDDAEAYRAIETVLKGKEVDLPEGEHFVDKEGTRRHRMRIRWWDEDATTYRSAFLGPESAVSTIPDEDLDHDHVITYAHHEKPCFLGHYWLEGPPAPLAPNIACLDYSVAKAGGKLVAYRFDGEAVLDAARFVAVAQRDL